MSLTSLGWDAHFARHFESYSETDFVPARIIRQDSNRYQVQHEHGLTTALPAGRNRHDPDAPIPTIGDWVVIEPTTDDQLSFIKAVLPRKSAFSRKQSGERTREQVIAANIDTLFLVSGLDKDFNPRRIERYVTQSWNSGAMPVILLNKADLHDDISMYLFEVGKAAPGVDVIAVSALASEGLDVLAPYLSEGKTVAFIGSSGVGKSTLVNRLLGNEYMTTGSVREDDSRGRHTTTHRELLVLPGGGMVIDTPGLRELQLWGDASNLEGAFSDLESLTEHCRFRDCTHEQEPGCALLDALDEGVIDEARYNSYMKLRREMQYLQQRQDERGRHKQKKRDKKFGRMVKQIKKHNPKYR